MPFHKASPAPMFIMRFLKGYVHEIGPGVRAARRYSAASAMFRLRNQPIIGRLTKYIMMP